MTMTDPSNGMPPSCLGLCRLRPAVAQSEASTPQLQTSGTEGGSRGVGGGVEKLLS